MCRRHVIIREQSVQNSMDVVFFNISNQKKMDILRWLHVNSVWRRALFRSKLGCVCMCAVEPQYVIERVAVVANDVTFEH